MQSSSICVYVISHFTNVICLCAAAWIFTAYDHAPTATSPRHHDSTAKLTFFFPHALHDSTPPWPPPFSYKLRMGKNAEPLKECRSNEPGSDGPVFT